MKTVERESPLPLYAQVKVAIRREIESEMKAGDALPTEPELEVRFGVSRITVRRALDELVAEGLIVRQQGRGTFVREPQITQDLGVLMSWTQSMRQMGYEPRTVSCVIDTVEPPPEVATMLNVARGEQVVHIRRLRYAGDEPICFMTNYLPTNLLTNVEERGLVDDSVHATLLSLGIKPTRADDKVEARPATEGEAEQLHIPAWSPLLQVTRLASDSSGRPLYVAVVASRADRYSYTVHFGG
jgi:GntR family transcriptional regulator